MRVIKCIANIRKLRDEGNISAELAEHIEAKVERLKDILEPSLNIPARRSRLSGHKETA